ncbi:hypothetical protein CMK11_04575 [Candidatus Poribacteria bacterium]|nr:hypothetical protein [Candidatus Poribacteria bacterium]
MHPARRGKPTWAHTAATCVCLGLLAGVAVADWRPRANTLFHHQAHRAVTVNSRLYALGGRTVEAWDTGIRPVAPTPHALSTTWGSLRREQPPGPRADGIARDRPE